MTTNPDLPLARYFIALLPPQEMQDYANQVRQHFADHYASRKAFNSPPHITLEPPFEWDLAQEADLITSLQVFAQSQTSIPITLSGFGSFPPKVIFINVLRTFELLAMQTTVALHCRDQLGLGDRYPSRPFMPHMTVAFRDLTSENFQAAWPEFQHRRLDLINESDGNYQFIADRLTLLKHDGQRWQGDRDFPLAVFPA